MRDREAAARETDLEALLRLLGEPAAVEGELADRKRHVLAGLARIVGADAWVWALQELEPERLETGYLAVLDGGWETEEQRFRCLTGAFSDALQTLVRPLASRLSEHVTVVRSELLDDPAWRVSPFFVEHRAPVGLDDFLFSFRPIDGNWQSAVRFHRRLGRPPFAEREQHVVHLATGALEWLHAAELSRESLPSLAGLSRREREVLLLLLQGDSRKQVAGKLRLSEHTVAGYVKHVHQRLGVHSRGELLARFIPDSRRRALAD